METTENTIIPSSENVSRLLATDWVEEGKIQHTAFMLRTGETYISVNRPAIDTYNQDIATFLASHPNYLMGESKDTYQCAKLNVGDVMGINVQYEGRVIDVNVEVEPRDIHTKSHAGIFTRYDNTNIKNGQMLKIEPMEEEISTDIILLEVRFHLLQLATLEQHQK